MTTPIPSRPRQTRQANNTTGSGSGFGDAMATAVLEFLERPVQFIVMRIGNTSTNSAPELLPPPQPLEVIEDTPLSIQLEYVDAELDLVDFELLSVPRLGNVTLSVDGYLTFAPCQHCVGMDVIQIRVRERPIGENHIPLEDMGQLVFVLSNENDVPLLYHVQSPSTGGDKEGVSEETILNSYIDANRLSPATIASVVAFDYDGYQDDLRLAVLQDGRYGSVGFQTRLDAVSVYESLPASLTFPNPALSEYLGYVTFLSSHVTYQPFDEAFVGNDTVAIVALDISNRQSQLLYVEVEVLPSRCENDGVCGGSATDPECEDIGRRRAEPGEYNCTCPVGFTGEVCEIVLMVPEQPITRGELADLFIGHLLEHISY